MTAVRTDIFGPLDESSGTWTRRIVASAENGWLAAACLVVCLVAVVVAAAGASPEAVAGRALLELLVVGVPMAAGLYALRSATTARFGVALLATGCLWSLTALGESSISELYTVGRVATWLIFPCVAYLVLAFPDGRIADGLDRAIFFGLIALAAILFVGTAPFIAAFPPLTVWATCAAECPPNALFVLDRTPALMSSVVLIREWLVMLVWVGLFVSMASRWRRSSMVQQRVVGPVFAAAVALGVTHITFHAARQLGAAPQLVINLAWLWAMCVVAVCAAILFGVLWRRSLLARALVRLGAGLRVSDRPLDIRDALADALGDPSLSLLYRDDAASGWRDERGVATAWPPKLEAGRAVSVVAQAPGQPAIALIHDVALRDDAELLDGVIGMIVASRRQHRMTQDLAAAIDDLERSSQRAAEAADVERQRIGRDLHDGAQQRLVALRIRLALAEERLRTDPVGGMQELRELGGEVDTALEELRSLAGGAFPAALVDHGLGAALRSLATQSPVPVEVDTQDIARLPADLESALYFTCAEALQNAAKHASGATGVVVSLSRSGDVLRLEIRDDGQGFAPEAATGRGLANMRQRMAAVGGSLAITSTPGGGTSVVATASIADERAGPGERPTR